MNFDIDKSAKNALIYIWRCKMRKLKDIRLEKKMTQQQVSELVGISLRSYKSYENEKEKEGTIKYKYIMEKLCQINPIDEEHGILDLDDIEKKCTEVLKKYNVSFCYLFGSYAKDIAKETSDVDLLISSEVTGLKFFGMVEEIRTSLHKKVDVLDIKQLKDNFELTQEILKDGIKICGKRKK